MHFAKTALAHKFSLRRSSLTAAAAMAIAASLAAAPAVFAAKENEHQMDLGPGCTPERPAIAHHAGGVIVKADEDERAPIPCATSTGWRTSEISIAITNEGTVLFQPAFFKAGLPIGLIGSVDRGASWDFILRSAVGVPVTNSIDQNLWVDRDTGR